MAFRCILFQAGKRTDAGSFRFSQVPAASPALLLIPSVALWPCGLGGGGVVLAAKVGDIMRSRLAAQSPLRASSSSRTTLASIASRTAR